MSTGAIVVALISTGVLWGGFAYCLSIALRKNK